MPLLLKFEVLKNQPSTVNAPAPKVTPGLIPKDWLVPLKTKLPAIPAG